MKLTLITAGAVIGLRLLLFKMGRPPEGTDFMIVHFLAIVTLVFFTGQRMLSGDSRCPFSDILRDGFRNAATYALLLGGFLWMFYNFVDRQEFPTKINERVAAVMAEGKTEAEARNGLEAFFNPFNYASITFFLLLAVGAFNALVIGLLHHKVLRRLRP
ncbi:MAG: hypothetical protein IPH05_05760 [Flavobacteriales bacterium]|jgi:hypothetical protein|nr:hypothetical protein [Flavobacteriales bacterium]MBK6550885.1 hypothetical protein [Flavobacteriales bacterium]MBK6882440.1 hypothetical protein [Flavobacteriales bacterium]MBK7101346.1 hypothetical protein [Flavobacteriales bacterium]MBK7112054.1 hypothetical protein [Flavobacteriales bacterium]